jgi:hypothetical protein
MPLLIDLKIDSQQILWTQVVASLPTLRTDILIGWQTLWELRSLY